MPTLTMHTSIFVAVLTACLLAPSIGNAEEFFVNRPDGARVSVIADIPLGDGPYPAIVLAPGQGYHMGLPALEETAHALVKNGVAVFRFNWAYFTAQPKGQPSEDLANELQDLQAVLSAARRHSRVAAQNVSVGGKSLGSVVAWQAFRADPKLKSVLLLTPICSRVPPGEKTPRSEAQENYPGFDSELRPALAVSGNSDPLCAATVLYRFAANATASPRVAIVGGNHGFENPWLPTPAAEAAQVRNVAAVAALAAGFMVEIANGQGKSVP